MWRVPAEDWDEELSKGSMIAPLDLDAALARWGDRITGAAAFPRRTAPAVRLPGAARAALDARPHGGPSDRRRVSVC